MKQKLNRGDKVRISKDLGLTALPSGVLAIVIGSEREEDGLGSNRSYTLNVKGHGIFSWYAEHQLTLVKAAPFVSVKFNGK